VAAEIVLIAGLALLVAGVLGITRQFLRRPRRRRLREALVFYRRALHLFDHGEHDDAVAMGREAVETWTQAGPTIASPALVGRLARLAAELGAGLHEVGRDEDAIVHLTAAEVALRDRVDAAPVRYRPALAELLALRAAVEGRLGHYAEALRYDGQALPLLHRLVETDDPEGYALPLAHALAVEARHFYEIGRLAEALACVHQAVERLRAVPDRDRQRASAYVAHSTADRAAILLAAGRTNDALTAAQEAVALRLGAHDPDRLRSCLALTALGEALVRLDRAAEAITPLRDAVALARVATATDARRGTPWLASSLSTLAAAQALDAQGTGGLDTVDKEVAEEALGNALEAERIARTLAEADPAGHSALLAQTACALARAYQTLGRTDEARPYADEAVRLYEQVSKGRGHRFDVESERAAAVRSHLAS
jgi:tetratricopeptide (TPR) repeat protein